MCFISSEKYPTEGDYKNFIRQHAGTTNGTTSAEHTNYHFTISNDYLEEALDRFAQFFISPLFAENAIMREVEAIDKEYKKNLQIDSRRLYQLMKESCNEKHPFKKFGTGNVQTLKLDPEANNLNVREYLVNFFNRHYSSNQMKLSNNHIDRHGFYPSASDVTTVFEQSDLAKLFKYEPVTDTTDLTLLFPLSIDCPKIIQGRNMYYKSSSIACLTHLFGHEGKGSLYSLLKNKGWAESLVSSTYSYNGVNDPAKEFSLFFVKINLTKTGIIYWKEIVEYVFEYIHILKTQGVPRFLFEEISFLQKLAFDNAQFTSAYASSLSTSLQKHLVEDVISALFLHYEFDEDHTNSLLTYFHPDNMNIYLSSKNHEDLDCSERWYDIKYRKCDFDPDFMNKLRNKKHETPQLHIPFKNTYIPYNLGLVNDTNAPTEYPVKIVDSPKIKTYFKKDDYFNTPRADIIVLLTIPQSFESPLNIVYVELFVDMVRYLLNEELYMASIAKIGSAITNVERGVHIHVNGFSEHLVDVIMVILEEMVKAADDRSHLTQHIFDYIKQNNLRSHQNKKFSFQSHEIATYESSKLFLQRKFTFFEFAEVLERVELDEFKNFVKCWLCGTVIPILNYDPSNQNSAILISYQIGYRSLRSDCLLELFTQICSSKYFTHMRTQKQFGYIVTCGQRFIHNVSFLSCIIQTTEHELTDILTENDNFFKNNISKLLDELTDEQFNDIVDSIVQKTLEKEKTVQQRSQRFWNEIENRQLKFNRHALKAVQFKQLSKKDVCEFYEHFVLATGPLFQPKCSYSGGQYSIQKYLGVLL
ncbi:hypothetical protein C9374_011909 [Naegleria lovaniensis]|uniref:Uncharacterized protein n=1 Tax=Naegleria lovaniensis TaxID=51637 RepID=A0AA88G8L1_NAELO|nr:uncharacterized protein C9374_011909 [Naegleria lovaniensis]KAG2373620.1 hypothetical protein C9374_011909 [Naegleria lovaniensis]